MPSRRKLRRYPTWYYELIFKAQTTVVNLKVSRPDILRRDLYNFRSALREEALLHPDNEWLQLSTQRANRLTFSIQGNQLQVHHSGLVVENLGELMK